MSDAVPVTARLALRELRDDDLDVVADMLGDPRVMAFWPAPLTREESRDWIARQRARYGTDGCGYWLATTRDGGEVVGQAGVLVLDLPTGREPGLGYILRAEHRGRGYATELARACRDWALRRLGAERVVVLIRPENAPSLRVVERLGAQEVGRMEWAGYDHRVFELRAGEAGPAEDADASDATGGRRA